MTHYEMVELLRTKASVSYEEAKEALEKTNWDLLDAMVLLERQGKVKSGGAAFTTGSKEEAEEEGAKGHKEVDFKGGLRRLFCWLRKMIGIGNVNHLVVSRGGEEMISLPVTVCVLLLLIAFWLVVILFVVGLFTGFRYAFRGPNLGKDKINDTIRKASEMADNFKADVVGENQNKK